MFAPPSVARWPARPAHGAARTGAPTTCRLRGGARALQPGTPPLGASGERCHPPRALATAAAIDNHPERLHGPAGAEGRRSAAAVADPPATVLAVPPLLTVSPTDFQLAPGELGHVERTKPLAPSDTCCCSCCHLRQRTVSVCVDALPPTARRRHCAKPPTCLRLCRRATTTAPWSSGAATQMRTCVQH